MSTTKIDLKINNIPVSVEQGTTILDAARQAGIKIPTLCYLRETNEIGACRICVVEVKGMRNMVAACVYPCANGMEVYTATEKVLKARKTTLELILSDHDQKCLSCVRSGKCELQKLSNEYGCNSDRFAGAKNEFEKDDTSEWLVRDNNKCIVCRRCSSMCNSVQEVAVIGANERGFATNIGCAFDSSIAKSPCVACGQCINVCPTGALSEKDDTALVYKALQDPKKHVVVGTAPSVRVGLGEEFDLPMGTNVEGKMVAALRRLGFDRVFDVNVTADLTIMEEGYELLHRLGDKFATLPMITSCSPGWIRYIELYYPELLPHLSTCKSPQQMFGAVVKTYYAEKFNIPAADIFVVSVMPCTAKKFERTRDCQNAAGVQDIDAVLTSRELARMIKKSGVDFNALANEEFDTPLGISSTAGLLFGATGGVMEAALRTVAERVNGKPLESLDFKEVRGTKGIKEAQYNVGGKEVKVCVASGISNAKKILDKIAKGKAEYHFIEIMTCPGGCVNGGGQPIQCADVHNFDNIKAIRAKAIYKKDASEKIRKSHENPVIKTLYNDYFGEPNSHKCHKILHTKYTKRDKYPD